MAIWRMMMVGAAAMAVVVPAHAGVLTGYLKIPDIEGESERAKPGVEPDEIDARASGAAAAQVGSGRTQSRARVEANAAASAGGNREFNIGMPPTAARKDSGEAHLDYLTISMTGASEEHDAAHVVQQRGAGAAAADRDHKDWIPLQNVTWGSSTAPRRAANASFLPPEGQTGEGWVTLPAALPDCRVGARYPHALVGDEGGREVKLLGVSVARCAGEEVTLNYEKIKWEY